MAIFCGHLSRAGSRRCSATARQTRDWVDVSDVVRANLLAAESDADAGRSTSATAARPRCSTCSTRCDDVAPDAEPLDAEVRARAPGRGAAQLSRRHAGPGRLGWEPQVELRDGLRTILAGL